MTTHQKAEYPTPELIARLNLDYFRGSVISLLTQAAKADNPAELYKQADTLCLQAYDLLYSTSPSLSNNFTSYELELYAESNGLDNMLSSFKTLMGNDWAATLMEIRKLRK